MRHGTEPSGIDIPLEVLPAHAKFVDTGLKLLEGSLTLGTADNLSDLREEHIHSADSLAILILLHVESLDILREIDEDNRLAEMFLHKIALMLALEVGTPMYRVLELLTFADSLLEDFDSLGICNFFKGYAKHASEALDKAVVIFVIKELQVVHAVVKSVLDEILHELLGKGHVIVDVIEGHLRLDHPELCEVARSIGVLGTEGRTESIDLAYGSSAELAFKLAADGKAGLFAEEVLAEIDLALMHRNICKIHGSNLEHVACTLCVRLCDERSMEIYEALVVEELMDSESHCVPDTEHCAESVGAEPHMGNRTEVLEGSILLLEREAHRIAFAIDFDLLCLDLYSLAAADRLHEVTLYRKAGAGGNLLEELLVEEAGVCDYLDIIDGRTVVECDELNLFVSSLSPHPSFGKDFLAWLAFQQVFYLCSG